MPDQEKSVAHHRKGHQSVVLQFRQLKIKLSTDCEIMCVEVTETSCHRHREDVRPTAREHKKVTQHVPTGLIWKNWPLDAF